MKKFKILSSFVLIIISFIFISYPVQAAAPQFTAARPTFLYGGGISSSATTIKLTSLVTPDGTPITTAQVVGGVGNVFYITIEPSTTKKETVSCTTITQNGDGTAVLTGCIRGLQFTYPYTALSALALSHSGGSSVVLSNSPQLYQDIIAYVNSSLAGGVNNASEIAKGIVQLATSLQQASSTPIGGSSTDAALVLYSLNSTSTYNAVTAPLKVVVTQNSGKIDNNFIATTTLFRNANFTGTTTMATTTINTFTPFALLGSTTTSIVAGVGSLDIFNLPPRNNYTVIATIIPATANTDKPSITFNGDGGANYTYSGKNFGNTGAVSILPLTTSNLTAGTTTMMFQISNISGTPKYMTGSGLIGGAKGAFPTATSSIFALWDSTTLINRMTITESSMLIASGSRLDVYGDSF